MIDRRLVVVDILIMILMFLIYDILIGIQIMIQFNSY